MYFDLINHAVFAVVTISSLGFIRYLKLKKITYSKRIFISMIYSVAVGVFIKYLYMPLSQTDFETINFLTNNYFSTIGTIYINFMMMVLYPLIITVVILGISSLGTSADIKKIGIKTFYYFIITAIFASLIGLVVGLLFKNFIWSFDSNFMLDYPQMRDYSLYLERANPAKALISRLPSNIILNIANGQIVAVVIFAVIVGFSILRIKEIEKAKPFLDFLKSFESVIFSVTKFVISLTPYGIFGFMAPIPILYGVDKLIPVSLFIVAVYIACFLQIFIVYNPLLLLNKVNLKSFYKGSWPALANAMATRSSIGTLPITLDCLKVNLKVPNKIASFVAPLGSSMNMNACGGLYPMLVLIFISYMTGTEFTIFQYGLAIISSTLISLTMAGVPGTVIVITSSLVASFNLPLEIYGILIGVDLIMDMFRTLVNVLGDMVTAVIVAKKVKITDDN